MLGVVAVLMSASVVPAAIWANAYEIKDGPLSVPQAGSYTVWVWGADGPNAVTIAGKVLSASGAGWKWVKAGTMELEAGLVQVSAPESVAAVFLTTDEQADPASLMPDRRVLDAAKCVDDQRIAHPRFTDYIYSMPQFASREEWEAYAAKLRRRILVAAGLFPLPERTPLNAHISGRVTHEDCTVEKVYFEARPGFLCTGNLYRPIGNGPFPGVATPHGHWDHGRLENSDLGSIPGRCITLARMGMVVFSYDMIGYNDSLQFPHNWGSPADSLWGVHPFSMQLWTSMRVLDFLESLPEVDRDRLACTGASGGGTQTFALMSVDPRVKVAAPVNMISRRMQGGCLCENAPLLRIGNSNMEIGALMAPRPLLLVSATGDWTTETPYYEYPAIRGIYRLYGAEDRVRNVHIDAPHNYNKDSREAVYRFFGAWLLGDPAKWADFKEPPFTMEALDALRVFPDSQLPKGTPSKEEVIKHVKEAARAKWQAILPADAEGLARFKQEYGAALADIMAAAPPQAKDIDPERLDRLERETHFLERWVIRWPSTGDAIPALVYVPKRLGAMDAVLLTHGGGKAALADPDKPGPGPLVAKLLEQGRLVMVIDTFLQGEYNSPFARMKREAVGVFLGRSEIRPSEVFMPEDTAYRVQDILTAAAYLRNRLDCTGTVSLAGVAEAGLWTLFASALDPAVAKTWVDFNHFDVEDDAAWVEQCYVPSIRSIGDVTTAAALIAPRPLCVANADRAVESIRRMYQAGGVDAFKAVEGPVEPDAIAAAVLQ